MAGTANSEVGLLGPYRVLDLCDERGEIAGMVMGDLGADVIRIEPPGGCSARSHGPRLDAGPESERSLQFHAYNRNKRSIVLDLEAESDRASFEALARGADFVLESAPPGGLAAHGFDFAWLKTANPKIVHVQITPFGSDGPYADYPANDLTIAALGGPMSVQGVPERAPVRVTIPQVWRHAGVEAVVAALVAHARMLQTGEAQFADVSAQLAMTWTMLNAPLAAAIQGRDFERQGSALQLGAITYPLVYECTDGHVVALGGGSVFGQLLPWMIEDGVVDASWLEREDWATYDRRIILGEPVTVPREETFATFERFIARHTKQELFERGLRDGFTVAPVNTLADLAEFRQLEERAFFEPTTLADGRSARAPGAFAKTTPNPITFRRSAPRLGEHADEIRTELASGGRSPVHVDTAPLGGELPFSGLKVADFTWIGVGPISTRCLADHGATVVKVECEERPDGLRGAGPFMDGQPGRNRSQFFGDFNTSKLSLSLDLKQPGATGIARDLLAWSDVFIESYTPGAIARLGLDYETARALNPSIIMLSTCLMGQYGPASPMAGFGYHAGAVAGFYELTGWPELPPVGPWQAYTDTIAPRFLLSTLLSAVDHRRRTGQGQHIDAAQMEMALQFLAPELIEYALTGIVPTRAGNRARDASPQGVYPCAGDDQWCAIGVDTDAQWAALRAAMGEPAWARDAEFDDTHGRLARSNDLDDHLAEWTRSRTPREVMDLLLPAGVPAGAVQRSSDLLRDPQLAHRRYHRTYDHADMGRIPYSGHQFRIAGYESGARSPAPLLGEHSFQVLKEILGRSDEEISELAVAGIIG